jgi:hypothetical protein
MTKFKRKKGATPPRRRIAVQAEIMRKAGWVSPREAARMVGVATVTIYYWMNTRRIDERRVAGRRYVSIATLMSYASAKEALTNG